MISNLKKLLYTFPLLLGFSSCQDKCFYYEERTTYEEILQPLSDIKSSFKVKEDYTIVQPGNIYTYGKYLLVGEKFKGIHILDNTNPASPVKIKFIELLANENFIVANHMLMADNGPDLLSIDISDMSNIRLVHREVNTNTANIKNDMFIAGYKETKNRVKVDCETSRFRNEDAGFAVTPGSVVSIPGTGKGGSMAKFAVIENYLYIINSSEVLPINISNPSLPDRKNKLGLQSNNVETVFPYKSYLYMGTTSGVLIYDCKTSKEVPSFVSNLRHVQGCDPVIVSDDMAFSTIRGGTSCRTNNVNELNVYNVSNPYSGTFVNTFPMLQPYGLGMKDQLLFICQGSKGLFVYDWKKNNNSIALRHSYPEIHAIDVIVNGNILIVTADNGLFQFDISNPDNITYMSKLANF